MKKRIFSVILAVVLLVTAIFSMPQIPKTTAYDTFGTNETWNSSYHALSEDAGTAEKPGYVGRFTHTIEPLKDENGNILYDMPTGFNEYDMPDKFAVISYNDCETLNDVDTGTQMFSDGNPTPMVDSLCDASVGAIKNLHGNIGENAYVLKMRTNYAGGYTQAQNAIATITNPNAFDVTNFQYMRFHLYSQNIEIQTGGYCIVQLHAETGTAQWDITNEIAASKVNNFFFDVTNVGGIISKIEIHCSGIRRLSNDTAVSRMLFDNFRFVRNTTYSDTFSYTPTKKVFHFNDCEDLSTIQNIPASGYSNYQKFMQITTSAGSTVDGKGSFVYGPNGAGNLQGYGVNDWYQVAFQNSQGVVPSDYGYFRFYMYLGNNVKGALDNDVDIYFNTALDYKNNTGIVNNDTSLQYKGVKVYNYTLDQGWYMITLNCQTLHKRIYSVSICFNDMNIAQPTGDNQDQAKMHIDYVHFFGYDYTPNVGYPYLAGHYKLLDGFEEGTATTDNTNFLSQAVSHQAYTLEPQYKGNVDGWASVRGTTQTHPETGNGMFGAGFPHTVTQGRYAMIWRPNINNNRNDAWIRRTFDEAQNLSKFTHLSLDFTVRDMQQAAPNNKRANQVGLTGTNERFMISLRDGNGNTSNLVFYLQRTHNVTTFIYSPDHGIEGFPLYGFIPGYNEKDHGPQYTPVGPMRLVMNMGQIVEHATSGFDVTNIVGFDFTYVRSGGGRPNDAYEYTTNDSRRCDFYLDNLVAFTPDMTLNVQVTGADPADAGQRVVAHVNGNDTVTNHVDIEYSSDPFTNNGLEIIKHLPLNSYIVSLEPWAWRYHQEKKRIYDNTSLPMYNDTGPDGYTGKSLGYKAICNYKATYLNKTITFDLTRYHPKWLDGNGYSVF